MPFNVNPVANAAETAEFTLDPELTGEPAIVLVVRFAGYGNSAWAAAMDEIQDVSLATEAGRQVRREQLVKPLATLVLKDWRGVLEDGKPVACTPEVAERFLRWWCQPRQSGETDASFGLRVGEYNRLINFVQANRVFRLKKQDPEQLGKG